MRPVRRITAEEENFRIEDVGAFGIIRRDPIEPEPVGTIILTAFQITGYDRDCDGSLMARFRQVDCYMRPTGWEEDSIELCPDTDLVITPEELKSLFEEGERPKL